MNGKRSFIWDLDGTLLDSYGIIVSSLREAYLSFGVDIPAQEINCGVIATSVSSYESEMADVTGIPAEKVAEKYAELSRPRVEDIPAMKNASAILEALIARGDENYVYTHRGRTSVPVLERLGLKGCFKDIITAESGFPRKPDPAALNYILEKHGIEKENACYVGDRIIDMDCAANAGITGILFLPHGSCCVPNGAESFIVHELTEIAFI